MRKPIKGFEGLYEISDKGEVITLERTLPTPTAKYTLKERKSFGYKDKKGYLNFDFRRKGGKTVKVHRLVAETFIPNPNNLPQINHKDGNKQNNCVKNLEWCDNSYNQIHAHKTGLFPKYEDTVGWGRPARPVAMLDFNTKEVLRTFETLASVKRETGINQFNVRSVCLGLRNHAGGYDWKFINEGDGE